MERIVWRYVTIVGDANGKNRLKILSIVVDVNGDVLKPTENVMQRHICYTNGTLNNSDTCSVEPK